MKTKTRKGWRIRLRGCPPGHVLVEVDGAWQLIPKTDTAIRGRIVGSILRRAD